MNLRDAGLPDSHYGSHLLHCKFFKVIKSQYLLLFLRQLGNRPCQNLLPLRAQTNEKRCVLDRARQRVTEIFDLTIQGRFYIKTDDFQAVQFGEKLLKLTQIELQFLRDLYVRGSSAEFHAEFALRLFNLPGLAPQVPSSPVDLAETVKNGAPYA